MSSGAATLRIDVVSLFPETVQAALAASIPARAVERGLAELKVHDLREWGIGKHRAVDDEPYGGGAGMLMRPEPLVDAIEALRGEKSTVILLDAGGERLQQARVRSLATGGHLIVLCGRYEGIDHRVREHLVDGELSIGDVVLNGGEVAACLVVEAVVRLLPGAMGNHASPVHESFGQHGLLEEPQYTRPAEFRGWPVPEVLRGGDHARIQRWRTAQALHRTIRYRPDLIEARGGLSETDRRLLEEFPSLTYP